MALEPEGPGKDALQPDGARRDGGRYEPPEATDLGPLVELTLGGIVTTPTSPTVTRP